MSSWVTESRSRPASMTLARAQQAKRRLPAPRDRARSPRGQTRVKSTKAAKLNLPRASQKVNPRTAAASRIPQHLRYSSSPHRSTLARTRGKRSSSRLALRLNSGQTATKSFSRQAHLENAPSGSCDFRHVRGTGKPCANGPIRRSFGPLRPGWPVFCRHALGTRPL